MSEKRFLRTGIRDAACLRRFYALRSCSATVLAPSSSLSHHLYNYYYLLLITCIIIITAIINFIIIIIIIVFMWYTIVAFDSYNKRISSNHIRIYMSKLHSNLAPLFSFDVPRARGLIYALCIHLCIINVLMRRYCTICVCHILFQRIYNAYAYA